MKREPVTEKSFRAVCDLMQQVGDSNLKLGYAIFKEYLPRVIATGNHRWTHVLLMSWAHAKESLDFFGSADTLYTEARENAAKYPQEYRESLVGTILLYLEWGKKDSLNKYLNLSETLCAQAKDSENLSFTYTFRAMSQLDNPDTMKYYLTRAIDLAKDLPDKNALFTARYNYAVVDCQNNPQKEVEVLESLLQLAKDPSLSHYPPKLYERTDFTFRNPVPSIYYNLMQVNLLLTDYDNAEKYAQLFYNTTITPHPTRVEAPYFDAEMAIVEAYKGNYSNATAYLNKSRKLFHLPEDQIPYISYFIAAGLLAEHKKNYQKSLSYFRTALTKGNTEGLYLMPPEIYYAHALILNGSLGKASQIFAQFKEHLQKESYSAAGLYYYKYYAQLLKAQKNYPAYADALETYYAIKDSLININRYRAIREVEAKFRFREEQQKIAGLQKESVEQAATARRERIFYTALIVLAIVSVLLLLRNLYYRKRHERQAEALHQSQIKQMEEQAQVTAMQSAMEAEERERYHIADELHDEVGAMLSLASLNISSALEKENEDGHAEVKLSKAQEILSSISIVIRDLSHRLTPFIIERYGFKKAVEDLSYTVNLSGKIKLETVIIGFDDPQKYAISFQHELYRMIQELLHNIIKHAHASHAMLELVEHPDHIAIIVEDDGIGMGEPDEKKGKGLNTIQSKISYLNGKIEMSGKKERGSLIVIEIPVKS